jgi:hypothetical protein
VGFLDWFARRGGSTLVAPPPPRSGSKQDDPAGSLVSWQKQAWGYYKVLGEIHYASSFYARMLSGVRLYIEARDETGEWVEVEGDSPYIAQLERLENSRGGMAGIQGQYGTLTFVQGESMLACTLEEIGYDAAGNPLAGPDGLAYTECWEMLSAAELTYSRTNREYKRQTGGQGGGAAVTIPETDPDDPQPGTMIAYRFYHRDPEFSGLADSSMRAVLADCEELLLLKQSIRNTARNRGAGAGILCLPPSLGGNEVDMGDGVMVPKNAKAIYDALTAPIANEQSASAVTPVIMFGSDVTSQNAFHIDLRGAALYRETGLRDECIRRIAIGLDMPPEALLGTAGVNHWTAWQIDEAAWKNHGAPVARELVEQLTSALLAPVALSIGDDPRNVRVWYDATDVVEDPDRGRAAMEAHDRLVISDAAYREATGWEEDDAPTPEEYATRAANNQAIKSSTSNPARGEPKQGQASVTPERVIGMAEAAVLRCRELAGSRLRTKLNGDAPANLRVRIKTAQNADVAHRLGEDVRGDVDPDTLVAGAGQVFLSGLRKLGLDPGLAETLVRRVEEHAARTLFEPEPGDLPEEVLAVCGLVSMRL